MAREFIVIVEDNAKNRKLVRDVLQVKGYQTVETETAEEGIRLAQEAQPALILMDIQLQGMDGITALGHLRADPRTTEIPVIAISASAMAHDRQKIMGLDPMATRSSPSTCRISWRPCARCLTPPGARDGPREHPGLDSDGGWDPEGRQAPDRLPDGERLSRRDVGLAARGHRLGGGNGSWTSPH